MAIAFSLFISASPPVAAETGKNFHFNQSAQSVQVSAAGDIPISVVKQNLTAETEFLIRFEIPNLGYTPIGNQTGPFEINADLEAVSQPAKFTGKSNFRLTNKFADSGGGFRGFGDDAQARYKI